MFSTGHDCAHFTFLSAKYLISYFFLPIRIEEKHTRTPMIAHKTNTRLKFLYSNKKKTHFWRGWVFTYLVRLVKRVWNSIRVYKIVMFWKRFVHLIHTVRHLLGVFRFFTRVTTQINRKPRALNILNPMRVWQRNPLPLIRHYYYSNFSTVISETYNCNVCINNIL